MYIYNSTVIVETQHVWSIETVSDEQNGQLKSYLESADRQRDTFSDGWSDVLVHSSAKTWVTKGHKDHKSGRTSERHGTRSTTIQSPKEPVNEEGPAEQHDVVNTIMVQDP